jgi:hypothetical protein
MNELLLAAAVPITAFILIGGGTKLCNMLEERIGEEKTMQLLAGAFLFMLYFGLSYWAFTIELKVGR